jgi:hypothetical protein
MSAVSEFGSQPYRFDWEPTPMKLLKLHGSINWFPKRGSQRPYSVDSMMHFEDWYLKSTRVEESTTIKDHLETEPFIVPPVLTKQDLVEEPILRLVWSHALKKLSEADEVVFIGYSMPVTDIAASFLFTEACLPVSGVTIVDYAEKDEDNKKKKIIDAYWKVFPQVTDNQFYFEGALQWVRDNLNVP